MEPSRDPEYNSFCYNYVFGCAFLFHNNFKNGHNRINVS
jgi:hypothetical protein